MIGHNGAADGSDVLSFVGAEMEACGDQAAAVTNLFYKKSWEEPNRKQ